METIEDNHMPEDSSPAQPLPPVVEISRVKGKGKAREPVIIIEELDTPATRREKSVKKKAEKAARLAAEAEAAVQAGEDEPGSDSSSLSEADGAEAGTRSVKEGKRMRTRPSHSVTSTRAAANTTVTGPDIEPGTIVLGPGERLESGTLGQLVGVPSYNPSLTFFEFSLG